MKLMNEYRNMDLLNLISVWNMLCRGDAVRESDYESLFRVNGNLLSLVSNRSKTNYEDYPIVRSCLFAYRNGFLEFVDEILAARKKPQEIVNVMTRQEIQWLQYVLHKKIARLFFEEEDIAKLTEALSNIWEYDKTWDEAIQFNGISFPERMLTDNFIKTYRIIHDAIYQGHQISYDNNTGSGNTFHGTGHPARIEYSFWKGVFVVGLFSNENQRIISMRLDRLTNVEIIENSINQPELHQQQLKKLSKTIHMFVRDNNKGADRFFAVFSSFSKTVAKGTKVINNIEEPGYYVDLIYRIFDVDEIVERLLMMGKYCVVLEDDENKVKIEFITAVKEAYKRCDENK